jgi:hypothetical protein
MIALCAGFALRAVLRPRSGSSIEADGGQVDLNAEKARADLDQCRRRVPGGI